MIIAADKESWIKPREEIVHAKGKGTLQTYWLLPKREIAASQYQSSDGGTSEADLVVDALKLLNAEGQDGSEGSTPESILVITRIIRFLK